jgi:hypothetical protein
MDSAGRGLISWSGLESRCVRICNRRCDRSGDDRPDPRDGDQTLADWVALVPRKDLRLEASNPCLDIFDLADNHLQHLTGNIRYAPVHLVHDNRN